MRTATATAAIAAAAALLLPTAAALIATTPTRYDLDHLDLGSDHALPIVVANKGTTPARVWVVPAVLEDEEVRVDPPELTLEPGETREVVVHLLLAANASGGRHDPRIEFIEVPAQSAGTTLGRVAVSVPVVFWLRNLKVGNLEVRHALAGEESEARILVQNFMGRPLEADVRLSVLDASGAEVARAEGRTALTEPNASTTLNLTLPTRGLAAGAYVVRGEAVQEGATSNARTAPLYLGERRLAVGEPRVRVAPDGNVTFTARVSNPGTVPLDGAVAFEFSRAGGPARSALSEGGLLAPGEAREAEATLPLAAGEYAFRALTHWPGGKAEAEGPAFAVSAKDAAPPATAANATPLPLLLVACALGLAALARRRRA